MQVLDTGSRWSGARDGERSFMRTDVRSNPDTPEIDARTERDALLFAADDAHVQACRAQRRFFSLIAQIERTGSWEHQGAHDLAHWLKMRYGTSDWKARRWIGAAHALESCL
jgi:hypothetical protein